MTRKRVTTHRERRCTAHHGQSALLVTNAEQPLASACGPSVWIRPVPSQNTTVESQVRVAGPVAEPATTPLIATSELEFGYVGINERDTFLATENIVRTSSSEVHNAECKHNEEQNIPHFR